MIAFGVASDLLSGADQYRRKFERRPCFGLPLPFMVMAAVDLLLMLCGLVGCRHAA
jgi:hypothetical protein